MHLDGHPGGKHKEERVFPPPHILNYLSERPLVFSAVQPRCEDMEMDGMAGLHRACVKCFGSFSK